MAKKFAVLRDKLSPDARARSREMFQTLAAALPLRELRQAKALSQAKLAQTLQVNQAAES